MSSRTVFSLIVFLLAGSLRSAAQDPEALIRAAENAIKGKTSSGIFRMNIVTSDYERTMRMESWNVGTEKALVRILEPKQEADNRTLKLGNELWMYLRTTETTIKIPPSMMLQSWSGSDFTYDDMVREADLARDYVITLEGTETVEDAKSWKLRLVPRPDAAVVWGTLYYWIRQSDKLPAKVEYHDERGKLIRTMYFRDFRVMGGRRIPAIQRMESAIEPGRYTEVIIETMTFDKPIPGRLFSFKGLER